MSAHAPPVGCYHSFAFLAERIAVDKGLCDIQFSARSRIDIKFPGQPFKCSIHLRNIVVERKFDRNRIPGRLKRGLPDQGQSLPSVIDVRDEPAKHLKSNHSISGKAFHRVWVELQYKHFLVSEYSFSYFDLVHTRVAGNCGFLASACCRTLPGHIQT